MAQTLEELPLFPLDTVLFPHSPIQLHIFEPRYREMIEHCLEHEVPFGVVLIRSGSEVGGEAEPYMIGTAARIVSVHRYPDGRLDIKAEGEWRFRIRQLDESRSYLVGKAEPVIDEPLDESPTGLAVVDKARGLAEAYFASFFEGLELHVKNVKLHESPLVLSFLIASILQVPNLSKQLLLETTNTIDRLRDELDALEELLRQAKGPASPIHRVTAEEVVPLLSEN